MAQTKDPMTEAEISALTPKQLRNPNLTSLDLPYAMRDKINGRRAEDCRVNMLPEVTRELVREVLHPNHPNPPKERRPFDADGDWYRAGDVTKLVLARFGDDLSYVDAYFKPVSAKVGRILSNDPFIEREKYTRTAYLYRYTDEEVAEEREDAAQQAEQEREEAYEQARALEQHADTLGIRLEVVGRDYDQARVPVNDMARLLIALQAMVRS